MKTILTLLFTSIIITTAFTTQAQDKPTGPKSYIGFYGGVSDPKGDFASTDYYNNSSGLANLGVTYSISGARYLFKNLAIAGTISFSDQGRPTSDALQGLANGYIADFKTAESSNVVITQRYQNLNLLLGPQYTFVFGGLNIDLGVSGGLLKSFNTPEYLTTILITGLTTTTPTSTTFTQKSSSAAAFAYSGTLGLRYNVSDGFGLALRGEYVNCSGINIETDNYTQGRHVTKQPISVLQGTFGFYFNF